jgi:molecular chaperone GrpE
MSEFRAAGPEDSVLDPAAAHDTEPAASGNSSAEPQIAESQPEVEAELVADGPAAQPTQESEEAADSSLSEESLADKYLALAQRTQADFENYRKRTAREKEAAQARGVGRLARELLPALDNLERALAAAAADANADEQLIEGLRLVQRELLAALERVGVERYAAQGEVFDPELHEAVAHQPFDGAQAGAIVEVYQAGYRLGAVVIRPARVLVAA